MTRAELDELLDGDGVMFHAALIEHEGSRGIAIVLGENLTRVWQSSDTIVFWDNGEHTVLPDEFELIHYDLFGRVD